MHSLDTGGIFVQARAWLIAMSRDGVEIGPMAFSVGIAKLKVVLTTKVDL